MLTGSITFVAAYPATGAMAASVSRSAVVVFMAISFLSAPRVVAGGHPGGSAAAGRGAGEDLLDERLLDGVGVGDGQHPGPGVAGQPLVGGLGAGEEVDLVAEAGADR